MIKEFAKHPSAENEKSRKTKFDFNTIKPENDDEKNFFSLLSKGKKAIYDWGYDRIWVMEDCDNEKESKKYSMSGEDFIDRTDTDGVTSADIVYILEYNGITVEVRNADSFKTEDD